MVAMCSGAGISYGYVNTNQLADTLNAKYGWTAETAASHQEMVASSIIAGLIIGAGLGGKVM